MHFIMVFYINMYYLNIKVLKNLNLKNVQPTMPSCNPFIMFLILTITFFLRLFSYYYLTFLNSEGHSEFHADTYWLLAQVLKGSKSYLHAAVHKR